MSITTGCPITFKEANTFCKKANKYAIKPNSRRAYNDFNKFCTKLVEKNLNTVVSEVEKEKQLPAESYVISKDKDVPRIVDALIGDRTTNESDKLKKVIGTMDCYKLSDRITLKGHTIHSVFTQISEYMETVRNYQGDVAHRIYATIKEGTGGMSVKS